MGRPFHEAARAIRRVEADGPVPIEELVEVAGAGVGAVARWIVTGWLGQHLDAIKSRKDGGWYSSHQALFRFLAAVARESEWNEELAAEKAADLARRGIAVGAVPVAEVRKSLYQAVAARVRKK